MNARAMERYFSLFGALVLVIVGAACNDTQLSGHGFGGPPHGIPQIDVTPLPCNFYSVDSEGMLWRIDPNAVEAIAIGSTGVDVSFTDVTITPDNKILAITRFDVYEIAPDDASTQLIHDDLFDGQPVAADTLPDGRLLVGGDGEVAVVDMDLGTYDVVGALPGGWEFSGDIAVRSATAAYATARTDPSQEDHLFNFDLVTGAANDLGTLGSKNVFGLDYGCDGRLYGVVADVPPGFLYIDGSTAQSTMLGSPTGPATLWGAAGPADGV